MAKTRELLQIQIYVGPTADADRCRVNFIVKDDDEGTVVGVDKDINVGAQLHADLDALVTQMLTKLTPQDLSKTFTRPATSPF